MQLKCWIKYIVKIHGKLLQVTEKSAATVYKLSDSDMTPNLRSHLVTDAKRLKLIGEDFRAADGVSQEKAFQEGVWELWGEGPRGDKKKGPYKAYSSQDRYNLKYWVLEVACDAGGNPQALYKANQKTVCRAYANQATVTVTVKGYLLTGLER